MTFAFGHLIGAWLVGKGYEFNSKGKIHRYARFFLLLGGVLPDIDFLFEWVLGSSLHRTFTHSLTFVLFVFVTLFIISLFVKEKEIRKFTSILCLGMLVHIFIDFVSIQGVPLFWPLNYYFSIFAITIGKSGPTMINATTEFMRTSLKLAILDMGLGTIWIFYLWFSKKIDF